MIVDFACGFALARRDGSRRANRALGRKRLK